MPRSDPPRSPIASLLLIGAILGGATAAFTYTGGWFSPNRLTPAQMVDRLTPPGVDPAGHRRNHAKGICFTGTFEANGQGAALSRAPMLASGSYPVLGRLNFGTPDPHAADQTARVKGLGISIAASGQEWRSGMIEAPVFPVSTPEAFYELLGASGSKDPGAMPAFAAKHPELAAFGGWLKTAPWTASYANVPYHGLNAFLFVDGSGAAHPVRWMMRPEAARVDATPEELAKLGPDFLEADLKSRVGAGPLRWTMVVTVANPGDPTADPSKVWPADRKTVEVGTMVVRAVQDEPDGPCRDINFDPTVLPSGITVSDDPFPAARSSAYAKSYDRRTAEASAYPRSATTGAKP